LMSLNDLIECSNKVMLFTQQYGFGIDDLNLLLSPAASIIRNKFIFYT